MTLKESRSVVTESVKSRSGRRRIFGYGSILGLSLAVGGVGGCVAALYYAAMFGLINGVWHGLLPWLERGLPHASALLVLATVGGLAVGLATRWLGRPGEISAVVDNIHLRDGKIDLRQTPSMTIISLLSIAFGGSAGPEAPLVQIVGSLGSRFGRYLRGTADLVRMFTFCGMAAALGAFFGAPLGGAIFALEIPHRRGLEYYEALIPACLSAFAAFFVFRGLVGYDGPLYHFPELLASGGRTMVYAALLGCLGAGIGALFMVGFTRLGWMVHRLERFPVWLAAGGGLGIGLIALAVPRWFPATTLFWGELETAELIRGASEIASHGQGVAVMVLVGVAVLKLLAIGVTLQSGYRGGFIFPLFFVGAAVGLAVSIATQGLIAPAVASLCLMAAVNVAVTKTPLATTIILTTLSGTSMIPVIAVASLISFALTYRIGLIPTQRSREMQQPALPSKPAC